MGITYSLGVSQDQVVNCSSKKRFRMISRAFFEFYQNENKRVCAILESLILSKPIFFMICPSFANPQWFFFASDVPMLLYYSHFPVAIVALWLGLYVYIKNPKLLAARILLSIAIVFLLWILCDLVTWTSNNSSIIIFAWSFFGILYASLSLLIVYFTYVFLDGRDISFAKKLIFFAILLPIIILTPTQYNVDIFFLNACGISDGGLFFETVLGEGIRIYNLLMDDLFVIASMFQSTSSTFNFLQSFCSLT